MNLKGLTVHHIRQNEVTTNLEDYTQLLEQDLLPAINENLSVHPSQEIVWLHQSPTIDYLGPGADRKNHDVNANKILQFNRQIRHIFR